MSSPPKSDVYEPAASAPPVSRPAPLPTAPVKIDPVDVNPAHDLPAVTPERPNPPEPPEAADVSDKSSNGADATTAAPAQADAPPDSLTPAMALQKVQTPQALPTRPVVAARSFHIQPDGTVLDSNRSPLLPMPQAPSRPFWRQHAGALAGGVVGTVAAVKMHQTLKPLNLKRLYWQANTRWPEFNSLINTVTQPVLKGVRENGLLNGGLTWAKATLCLTPVMTAGLWGEQKQRQWQKSHRPATSTEPSP
jgi:hypothetical protein